MAKMQLPTVAYDTILFQGGMDTKTPLLLLPSSYVRDGLNFESSILGGYSRIGGYERYDGTALPSSKVATLVWVSSLVNIPANGDTLTGATSGATSIVLTTGSNYIVVAAPSGPYTVGETVKDGATVIGTVINATGGITASQSSLYKSLAANQQRALVAKVPGSGPVRGVFVYNGVLYAFRDNVGATATLLYKATNVSWSQITFYNEVYFTAGTTAPVEGNTLTQGGVTATIERVVLEKGAWSGTAAGRLIVTNPVGGNFAAGAATAPGSTMTLSGAQTAITMSVGGTFEIIQYNFSGAASTNRVYGCDGINRCWEFDGTVFVPINTYVTPDTPKHICAHMHYLFTSVGALITGSAPGLPYDVQAADGAGAFAMGDNVTNMIELPGAQTTAAMGVWTRNTTHILYGSSFSLSASAPFNLVVLNVGTGALDYTAQNMAHTYTMDDRGVSDMTQTLNYGNFNIDKVTYHINDFIEQKRTRVVCSSVNRLLSQYRMFFNDGYGLYITNLHGQYAWQNVASGMFPVLFPDVVNCTCNAKLADGSEANYIGLTSGYVCKLDSGTSFDGVAIAAHLVFGYNNSGSPRLLKRYRHAQLEINGTSYLELQFGYLLGYGTTSILQPNYATYASNLVSPTWDLFTWDAFTWDGQSIVPNECEMNGTALNCAIAIQSSSDQFDKFNLNSAIIHYSARRGQR